MKFKIWARINKNTTKTFFIFERSLVFEFLVGVFAKAVPLRYVPANVTSRNL